MLRFSKGNCSHGFYPISTKLFWKLAHISETAARRAKISSISAPWSRERVCVQLLELWPLSKFHAQIWQFWKSIICIRNLYSPIAYHWGIQAITFLGNRPSFTKVYGTLKFLHDRRLRSQWEKLKCGISRKRPIVERNGQKFVTYSLTLLMADPLSLLWGHSVHFAKFPILRLSYSKCYFPHNFHWSQSKLYENIAYHGEFKCLLEYCNEKLAP